MPTQNKNSLLPTKWPVVCHCDLYNGLPHGVRGEKSFLRHRTRHIQLQQFNHIARQAPSPIKSYHSSNEEENSLSSDLDDEDLCCEVSASDNGHGEDVEHTKSGTETSGSDNVECGKSGSDDGEEVEREVFGSDSDEDVDVRRAESESDYSEDVESMKGSEGNESTDLEVQRSDSISSNDEIK